MEEAPRAGQREVDVDRHRWCIDQDGDVMMMHDCYSLFLALALCYVLLCSYDRQMDDLYLIVCWFTTPQSMLPHVPLRPV